MRISRLFIISLFAVFIASCALVKTVYNNAPEAMHWWLDDYFDFTDAQNTKLKPALHKLHDWHRQTQLPLYIELLQKIKTDVTKDKMQPDIVCETIDTIQENVNAIQLETIPIIVEVAPLLSTKQLAYFHKMLEKRALKWKSEWLLESHAEQIEARLEKTIDYAEKVYGSLSRSQKAMLKQKLLASNYKPEIRYTEIIRRNEDALKIVTALTQESVDQSRKQKLVKQGFERLNSSPDLGYQNYTDQLKLHTCEMIADLHASTDIKQKQHARALIENYITQFNGLSIHKP